MKKIRQSLCIAMLGILIIPHGYADQEYINENTYTYYYGATCSHCIKVENYLKESGVDQRIHITTKEVQRNQENANTLLAEAENLGIPLNQVGTPFIVVTEPTGMKYALIGSDEALKHFQPLEQQIKELLESKELVPPVREDDPNRSEEEEVDPIELTNNGNEMVPPDRGDVTEGQGGLLIKETGSGTIVGGEEENTNPNKEISLGERMKFFAIMMPAALADSINPCAFAVMLLLLTTILSKTSNKKKALLSGLMFALAVFVTYFLLGMGVLQLLGNVESLFRLKRIVGIVGILVGLANLKDYFRYGKGFVMEVPMSWRPLMQKIVKKVTSPGGAFVIGIIVSLFLLPCSSGPYLTILGYLSAESQSLNLRGYIYLTVYNLIFVLPMVAIAALIGFGYSTAEKIGKFKNKNTKLIHLIVGLLMLGLGIYVIGSMYRRG